MLLLSHDTYCRIPNRNRDVSPLTACVDKDGIYYTPAVYTRVKRGGTIPAINALIVANDPSTIAELEILIVRQIKVAMGQLQREMGSHLQTPVVRETIIVDSEKYYRLNETNDDVVEK
jgi:hypothetical protein